MSEDSLKWSTEEPKKTPRKADEQFVIKPKRMRKSPKALKTEEEIFLAEQETKRAEQKNDDREIFEIINGIENVYDRDLILSLVPAAYDDDGERGRNYDDNFVLLPLAIDYVDTGRGDFKEFVGREMGEFRAEHRGLMEDNVVIRQWNNMIDNLNYLEKHTLHYNDIQRLTGDNVDVLSDMSRAIEADDSLKESLRQSYFNDSFEYLRNPESDTGRNVHKNSFSETLSSDDFMLRDEAGKRQPRPDYDRGIATIFIKEMIQKYHTTASKTERREIENDCRVVIKFCEGEGFGEQMKVALDTFENIYKSALSLMEGQNEFDYGATIYSGEEGVFTLRDMATMMSVMRVAERFRNDRKYYEYYLNRVKMGDKIVKEALKD